VAKMREILKDAKVKLESLNVDLTKAVSELERAMQRWNDFERGADKISEWIGDKINELNSLPEPRGEIGEMKTRQVSILQIIKPRFTGKKLLFLFIFFVIIFLEYTH
jgi:uncharacterized protein Yka (UPF0111/DUF47 family)